MKLADWAEKQGISYITAYRWFRAGKMPCKAIQSESGTILVSENNSTEKTVKAVVYCRVSNHSRKKEIEYQVERCEEYCRSKGYSVHGVYKEIASGMNDERKILWKMLDTKPTVIVVENKDRLTRFGFNYLERLLKEQGCVIDVINRDKFDESDLIKDMISIVTSFCCRLYGSRRGQNKAKKVKEIIDDTND